MAHNHSHIFGRTGTGKSTFVKDRILNDIKAGYAVIYIDPHGHDTNDILQRIPRSRRKDVVIFDPSTYLIPFNPLDPNRAQISAKTYNTAIRAAYGFSDMSTARMSSVIYNTLVSLMETRQGLFGLYFMLASKKYRDYIIPRIKNPVVLRHWCMLDTLPDKQYAEQVDSTLNKLQVLMGDERIRAISGSVSVLDINDMVKDKILFIRLPHGEFGVEDVSLLVDLLLAQIQQSCFSRPLMVPLSIYIDEAHHFAPSIIMELFSGIRKFNVSVHFVHQYLSQIDEAMQDCLAANADQYIFRVSKQDALKLQSPKPQDHQLYETPAFEYVVFRDGAYTRETTHTLDHPIYPASLRQIHANHVRNLVHPATKEIEEILAKYS